MFYILRLEQFKNTINRIIHYSIIVCQKDDFNINKTYIRACCENNDNILKCYTNNYIAVQYNEEITYEKGFQINKDNFPEFRKSINFIKNEENIITPSRELNIKSNSKKEIYLNNSIQSLASLIISDMNSLFSWYSSLKNWI